MTKFPPECFLLLLPTLVLLQVLPTHVFSLPYKEPKLKSSALLALKMPLTNSRISKELHPSVRPYNFPGEEATSMPREEVSPSSKRHRFKRSKMQRHYSPSTWSWGWASNQGWIPYIKLQAGLLANVIVSKAKFLAHLAQLKKVSALHFLDTMAYVSKSKLQPYPVPHKYGYKGTSYGWKQYAPSGGWQSTSSVAKYLAMPKGKVLKQYEGLKPESTDAGYASSMSGWGWPGSSTSKPVTPDKQPQQGGGGGGWSVPNFMSMLGGSGGGGGGWMPSGGGGSSLWRNIGYTIGTKLNILSKLFGSRKMPAVMMPWTSSGGHQGGWSAGPPPPPPGDYLENVWEAMPPKGGNQLDANYGPPPATNNGGKSSLSSDLKAPYYKPHGPSPIVSDYHHEENVTPVTGFNHNSIHSTGGGEAYQNFPNSGGYHEESQGEKPINVSPPGFSNTYAQRVRNFNLPISFSTVSGGGSSSPPSSTQSYHPMTTHSFSEKPMQVFDYPGKFGPHPPISTAYDGTSNNQNLNQQLHHNQQLQHLGGPVIGSPPNIPENSGYGYNYGSGNEYGGGGSQVSFSKEFANAPMPPGFAQDEPEELFNLKRSDNKKEASSTGKQTAEKFVYDIKSLKGFSRLAAS